MATRSDVRRVVVRLNPETVAGDAAVLKWLETVCPKDVRGHLIGMTNAIGDVLRQHGNTGKTRGILG